MDKVESRAVSKCQQGHLDEFSVLYDLYFQRIYSFVFYKTLHKETAEDITSKTFLKALDKIGSFNRTKGTFSAWLFVIAKRTIIDHYRTSKDCFDLFDCWEVSSKEDVFEKIADKQQLEKVSKYLKDLDAQKRDLVIMRVWQDMSYRQISQITGKTEASLKMMFSRTINKLRSSTLISLLLLKYILIQNN